MVGSQLKHRIGLNRRALEVLVEKLSQLYRENVEERAACLELGTENLALVAILPNSWSPQSQRAAANSQTT